MMPTARTMSPASGIPKLSPLGAIPILVLLASAAMAQEWRTWNRWPDHGGCMVVDERDARMLVFDSLAVPLAYTQGRSQLLQWNGQAFWPRLPEPPTGWNVDCACFERISQRVLAITRRGSNPPVASIWACDGTNWSQVPMPIPLQPYGSVALVQDPVRGQLAMVGYPAVPLSAPLQTWHFDGVGWTQAAMPGAPLVFGSISAAADTARGRIVLLNGGNHFEWDGVQWQLIGPAPGTTVAYDARRQRVVVHQGMGSIAEYDGSTWVQITASGPNGFTPVGSFVFDPTDGETLALVPPLSGGTPTLWSWNGSRWLQRGSTTASAITYSALHDPTRGRMIGLRDGPSALDLVAWEGDHWTVLGSGLPGMVMTFDSVRQRVVGTDGYVLYALTGTSMTPFATCPNLLFSMRDVFAGVGDPAGTLLNAGTPLFGTGFWTSTYDGATFRYLSPTLSAQPSTRAGARGAYHAASGGVVLFGGIGSQPLADTWVFRNSAWTQLFPVHAPPPAAYVWLAPDPQSGDLLLGGGRTNTIERFDVWSWDGTDWRSMPGRLPWSVGATAFDPVRGLLTTVNGFSLAFLSSQLPSIAAFGSGCGGGSRGAPTLHALGDPAIGNDTFALRVGNAAPGTMAFVMFALTTAPCTIGACTTYLSSPMTQAVLAADALGGRTFDVPVPLAPVLRGLDVYAQGGTIDFAPGALFGEYSLTPALALHVGD